MSRPARSTTKRARPSCACCRTPCRQTGRTVVVITHNQAFTAMADRVIHIRNGKVTAMEDESSPVSAETIEW